MARTFQNEQALASAPIGPLMLRLAAPAVAAQLINVLYNIVDRIYIGHIAVVGKTALTGVGVTFPILTLISAFSAFAGMGGAPLASIRLGAGDRKGLGTREYLDPADRIEVRYRPGPGGHWTAVRHGSSFQWLPMRLDLGCSSGKVMRIPLRSPCRILERP